MDPPLLAPSPNSLALVAPSATHTDTRVRRAQAETYDREGNLSQAYSLYWRCAKYVGGASSCDRVRRRHLSHPLPMTATR